MKNDKRDYDKEYARSDMLDEIVGKCEIAIAVLVVLWLLLS